MARKHRPSASASVRLPHDVNDAVKRLSSTTGWSSANAVAFLARAGWNAIGGKGEKVAGFRQLMTAAADHHEAETAVRKKLAITSSKLREARKALAPNPSPRR
jgi:hypothetical protein